MIRHRARGGCGKVLLGENVRSLVAWENGAGAALLGGDPGALVAFKYARCGTRDLNRCGPVAHIDRAP
jgi:hypothetical protein